MLPRLAALATLLLLPTLHSATVERALTDQPACRQAIDALGALESTAGARAELAAARQRAARACLGGRDGAASAPAARVRPPLAVPPVGAGPAVPLRTPVPAAAPAAPPAPPLTLSGCDANGCWTSDGTRLQRAGPNTLLGPRGLCTVNGSLVQCPP
jgi:hypothetical protein